MNRLSVNKNRNKFGCWPAEYQELLLKAALLKGKEAREAWTSWCSLVDPDHIDHESQMILPLLYRNLSALGIEDPRMNLYQGVKRKTWAKNHVVMHEIVPLLAKFHDSGIKTILLKGTAMLILYYNDYGLRPMEDVDMLVPVEKAKESIQILSESGWWIKKNSGPSFSEKYPAFVIENHFENPNGIQVDLHYHLLDECPYPNGDVDFWRASVLVTLKENLTVHALNPSDQLLHLIVHAMRWNPQPLMRWVADAMMIMKNEQEINWQRFIEQTKSRRLNLPVKNGLTYLHESFGAPVPDQVMSEIEKCPVTPFEYHEFHFQRSPGKLFSGLARLWYRYRRMDYRITSALNLWSFLKFLQYSREVKHMSYLPFYFISFWVRRNWFFIFRSTNRTGI
jgi:hypothetical protein